MNEKLLSVTEAESIIGSRLLHFPSQAVPLDQALGAVLAEQILAERDQPPFARVTMDGIAIAHSAFAAGNRRFNIQGTQAAGASPSSLGATDGCIEVMTGAVMPAACDTVIAVERIRIEDGAAVIEEGYRPESGQYIHRQGSDYRQGSALLEPGTRIGVPEIAILAANGKARVQVACSPRIAVISTGDEVVGIDQPVLDYQIRQSNSHAILAALAAAGHKQNSSLHLMDDPHSLREHLSAALDQNQVLILSGGVSRGNFDFVPGVLEELGVEKHVHRVAQRPGKPMWFGTRGRHQMVFALPGNPVSTLICLHRFVLPALAAGLGSAALAPRKDRLAGSLSCPGALTVFLPVTLAPDEHGQLLGKPRQTNTSGDFSSLSGTSGFVQLPARQDAFPVGFAADFYPWAG
ncbi:MAG: molybdopterin molybdotransferase MoeA [Gammaproteobacteria bacterium]|nr:molybdopterin molybdotransferase MoeA [Gammaproteobacteria bacterium]